MKISVVVTRQNVAQLDELEALADRYGAQLASPGCARRAAAPTAGTSCIPPSAAARSSTTGCWRTARRAHRRLVLPPVRAGRAAARAEPVRRRPGGVPDRPGRRRLRLPVRHPRAVPGRQCARRPVVHRGVARLRAVHRAARTRRPAGACASCGSYDACRGGCMAAKFFTGLPLRRPDPECVQGYGETALAARDGRAGDPQQPPRPLAHRGRSGPADAAGHAEHPCQDLRRVPAGGRSPAEAEPPPTRPGRGARDRRGPPPVLPALASLQLSRPWYLRGPAAWHPRRNRAAGGRRPGRGPRSDPGWSDRVRARLQRGTTGGAAARALPGPAQPSPAALHGAGAAGAYTLCATT